MGSHLGSGTSPESEPAEPVEVIDSEDAEVMEVEDVGGLEQCQRNCTESLGFVNYEL